MRTFAKLRRRTVFIVLISCILSLFAWIPPIAEAGTELLSNPGFEQVTAGKPDAWTAYSASSAYASTTSQVYAGFYSVKLDDTSSTGVTGLRSEHISVVVGRNYEASVHVYNVSGATNFYLEFWNSADQRIAYQSAANTAAGAWVRLELAGAAPASAAYATVLLYEGQANVGSAYFDDASFHEAPPDLNGGFESVSAGKPAKWTAFSASTSYQSAADIVYAGTYSVKLDDLSSSTASGLRSVKLPVDPGSMYEASVLSYNTAGSSLLYLEFWNSSDQSLYTAIDSNTSLNEWKRLSLKRNAPLDAAYATVLIYQGAANVGTAYFDEATLDEADGEAPRQFPQLVASHPRLYFTQSELPDIRARADDNTSTYRGQTGAQLWGELEQKAQSYLAEDEFTLSYGSVSVTYPLPPEQPEPIASPPGFSGVYPYWGNMGSALEDRLSVLSLAYAVTEDEAYAERAKSYALALAGWDTWTQPGVGVYTNRETAHISLGVSLVYDTLYDTLTPAERTALENALETKGLFPLYIDSIDRSNSNIQAVRAVALGVGGAALLGRSPNADRYLTRAYDYYDWYADTLFGSGEQEGLFYTNYATDNLLRAADAIARTTGVEELFSHPFFDDFIVRWMVDSMAPGGGGLLNYSDSVHDFPFDATMMLLNNRLGNGEAGWYLEQLANVGNPLYAFLYFNPQAAVALPEASPASAVLDPVGWATLRTGWEADDTLLGFVSNNSKAAHNHYDQNSFQIATNGSWIADDPGYQDYFNGPAQNFIKKTGHSTIRVDGQGQSQLGGGSLSEGILSPLYDYVKGSAASAYANPKLTRFDRHIVYVKPGYFVMLDDLQADAARTYEWVMFNGSLTEMSVDGQLALSGQSVPGDSAYVANHDAGLAVKFLSPDPLSVTIAQESGAERFGYVTKASNGTPAASQRLLTVLRPQPLDRAGLTVGADLLPPVASSGKLSKVVPVLDAGLAFYRAEAVGDYATYSFTVDAPGTYSIDSLNFMSPNYGKIQASIDGVPVGGVYDGYGALVQPALPFHLGDVALSAGPHTIRYEVVGKNASSADYFFGIEALQVVPIGSAQPTVRTIDASLVQAAGVIGAAIDRQDGSDWSDTVLFKTGSGSYAANGTASDGEQTVVTRDVYGEVAGYAITRGTYLEAGGETLIESAQPFSAAAAVDASSGYALQGLVKMSASASVTLRVSAAGQVTVNGQTLDEAEYDYDPLLHLLTVDLSAGENNIVVAP